ncbi:hypothetical protein [Gelria sp. Kuro-4]|jgi:hypothetical protein|uniref:hypothetical protein n=1 Tax=Gelria sp. Kuro-4 TaxID=2796927 RepID=UPI001BED5DAB|nr:hypothetical protein [Gelria sp. Kuro-4]MDK2927987.1 hypothetical protein [Bacillota bacterium]BCV25004.1 hypothetical protein kuro4_17770 [Gelria sp. Kuro-4]
MKYRGYRVDVVAAVALLTVALLLGVRLAYVRYFVERPLVNELQALPGVKDVKLSQARGRYNVKLALGRVDNLAEVYRQAEELAAASLGPGGFNLMLADERTPALEQVYYEIHYYVEEALVRGNFSEAAERIQSAARAAGVEEKFYVDQGHVYVELTQGPGYLYEVHQRPDRSQEGGEPA